MSNTSKPLSSLDSTEVLRAASVPEDRSLMVSGFSREKLGAKFNKPSQPQQ